MLVDEVVAGELGAAGLAGIVLHVHVQEAHLSLGGLGLAALDRHRIQMSASVFLIAVMALERVIAEPAGVHSSSLVVVGRALGPRVVVVEDPVEPDGAVTTRDVDDNFAVALGGRLAGGNRDCDSVGGVGALG